LIDDYKNLSNAEIMQIQLKKFRKEMDHAIKNHYHKIIFIHGVGNGVLRTEILRELRAYTGVRYTDAPFEKYGFGATEVILI
jgi:dsDNA-specific endonuclease/ATPase MutS2